LKRLARGRSHGTAKAAEPNFAIEGNAQGEVDTDVALLL
jgi:hypothetical protein